MGGNLWGDLNEIEEIRSPLDILKEQSGYLISATNSLLYTDLRRRTPIFDEPDCEFATIFSIKSKMLEKYEFNLFTMFYNVVFYPMEIELDENIAEKMNIQGNYIVDNEQEFIKFLKLALGNKYTKNVLSAMYTMSK